MGFPLQTVLMLIAEHRERPFRGPVLTLGRQTIYGSYEAVLDLFRQAGVAWAPVTDDMFATPPHLDTVLFAHLGLQWQVLDVADGLGADIVADLNRPIAADLEGRFGTVIDGGTIEHIFNVGTGFSNIARLVAPGGRVFHITPCNNYVNHGFWQLSPTAFFDFYRANGFVDCRATMIVHPRDGFLQRPWATFPYDPREHGGVNSFFSSRDDQLVCLFTARRTETSTADLIPMQSFFTRAAGSPDEAANAQFSLEYVEGALTVRRVG